MKYKCLHFLVMLEITFYIVHALFMNKLIETGFGVMSAGSIIVPSWGMLDDIITEVYGFKIAFRLYWLADCCLFMLSVIIFSILNSKSPATRMELKTFTYIFGHLNIFIVYAIIAGLISFWTNTYLLIKWKILLKGKYFWIRSICSSLIGDLVFLILITPSWVIFGPATNIAEAIHLSIISYTFRLTFYLILAFPSNFIVNLLKIIEKVDICDISISFNPFKKQNIEETKIYESNVI